MNTSLVPRFLSKERNVINNYKVIYPKDPRAKDLVLPSGQIGVAPGFASIGAFSKTYSPKVKVCYEQGLVIAKNHWPRKHPKLQFAKMNLNPKYRTFTAEFF